MNYKRLQELEEIEFENKHYGKKTKPKPMPKDEEDFHYQMEFKNDDHDNEDLQLYGKLFHKKTPIKNER